jgi:hypothetical protein
LINVPPWVQRLPPCRDTFSSRLLAPPAHANINISTISYYPPALCPPEDPCAVISGARETSPSTDSSLLSIFVSTSRPARRRPSVPVRSKQAALGSLRRADHPRPLCMLSVAVGGRCVTVVSARRVVSGDSFGVRWLKLLAKSRPMSLAVTSVIGRDVHKREHGRAFAQCGAHPLLSPFDKENLCWQATVWRSRL